MFSVPLPKELKGQRGVYVTGEEIGKGAISKVFLCQRIEDGVQFALKQICRFAYDGSGQKNLYFEQEMQACLLISQKQVTNLMTVVEVIQESQDIYYLIMELCEGSDLYMFSQNNNNKITQRDALIFSRQIANGVQELHSLELSHRDMKPENVFVKQGPYGSVIMKIGDFGLARQGEFMSSIVGTVSYMVPELFSDQDVHKDRSCDVWALGCIIYELLEGEQYFAAPTQIEVAKQIKQFKQHNKALTSLKYCEGIQCEVDKLISKCMKINPNDRITAEDVVQRLDQILSNYDQLYHQDKSSSQQFQQQKQSEQQQQQQIQLQQQLQNETKLQEKQNPQQSQELQQQPVILRGQHLEQQQPLQQQQHWEEHFIASSSSQSVSLNYSLTNTGFFYSSFFPKAEQEEILQQQQQFQQSQVSQVSQIIQEINQPDQLNKHNKRLLEDEVMPQDREEYEKDPLYPFYDFINALVSKQLNNKSATVKVVEPQHFSFCIESIKFYTKINWKIIFAYHYLINAMESNHCKKKHPELQKLLKSDKIMFQSDVLNMLNRIINSNFQELPEIKEFNNLKYKQLADVFHLNVTPETSQLEKTFKNIFNSVNWDIHMI